MGKRKEHTHFCSQDGSEMPRDGPKMVPRGLLGRSWSDLARLGANLGSLGAMLELLGAILGRSWSLLGRSWGDLGRPRGICLGRGSAALGPRVAPP